MALETQPRRADTKVVQWLSRLVTICHDSELGFAQAAERASDEEMRDMFEMFSQQRSNFAHELEYWMRSYAIDPPAKGSTAGALRRGWQQIASAMVTHNEKTLLENCELAEDVSEYTYREALADGNLPPAIRELVQRQFEVISEQHAQLKAMKDEPFSS